MKVKRQKHVRKALLFYRNNLGYTPPYHILIDGTFCKAALKFKINISEQLPKYMQAEVKIRTTQCVLAECELFGTMLYGPLKVLRQFPVKPCGHETPKSPVNCLKRMVTGHKCAEKFIVATQDQLLSDKLRKLHVPLLFISHNAITLEAPSASALDTAEAKVKANLCPTNEFTSLAALKSRLLPSDTAGDRLARRRPTTSTR
jgi:U3 small nucleolar RNA-associated protein 23